MPIRETLTMASPGPMEVGRSVSDVENWPGESSVIVFIVVEFV
jgi:hypothetical protein